MRRMSLRKFGRIVSEVVESLPPQIKQYLDNVVVDVEEEPSEELLREQGFTDEEIEAGETLLGIFIPMDISRPDEVNFLQEPHRIVVFKRPHEEEFPDPAELREEIRKTVIHEIGHHFGWNERDMEEHGLE
jgi:predicted Zn-dependent protease with MMP-like domain